MNFISGPPLSKRGNFFLNFYFYVYFYGTNERASVIIDLFSTYVKHLCR